MMKEITSLQHPILKHFVHLRQNRDYREDHRTLVIDGIKPISEVAHQLRIKTLLAYHPDLIPAHIKAETIYLVNEGMMKKVSGMQSPEGLIAEIEMPQPPSLKGLRYIIACDEINDPGNLGTILRTALALGWEGAFILNNSCDLYNEKTVRAARGAVFRLPIVQGSWDTLKSLIKENNLQPLAADITGVSLNGFQSPENVLLVLSNEARGLSENARLNCTPLKIPMPGEMESLNVAIAGGILMYALLRTN
jgi:TrmH family RNA methyltransferase